MKVVITPDEDWFPNPLDSMPIAQDHVAPEPEWGQNKYAPPERKAELEEELDLAPSEYEPPTDERWFENQKEEKEEEITMHEKMYRMATARYNPFSLGGSENCDSDISCNIGGSENASRL